MSGELTEFAARVERVIEPGAIKRVEIAAGMAAKTVSLAAASSALGGDRAFSGMRRHVRANVGFDLTGLSMVAVNFRPAGIWKLADTGRRGGKTIKPRNAIALRTPDGPRALSTVGAWGGKGTLKEAVAASRVAVPEAAFRAFQLEVIRVVH